MLIIPVKQISQHGQVFMFTVPTLTVALAPSFDSPIHVQSYQELLVLMEHWNQYLSKECVALSLCVASPFVASHHSAVALILSVVTVPFSSQHRLGIQV